MDYKNKIYKYNPYYQFLFIVCICHQKYGYDIND